MAQSKDATAALDPRARLQAWRSGIDTDGMPFRRYMQREEAETRQRTLKEDYMKWCDLVKVTKKARWHPSVITKLTQRFITYKLHQSRGKDRSGEEICMSWADLKLLAQDLRNIVEAATDTACIHEAEIIRFDINLKWHIHRICTQIPVLRPSKGLAAEVATVGGGSHEAVEDDDGYDSWEESPSPEDLHVDWAAYAEEVDVVLKEPKEEAEQQEYKIVVGGDVEVKGKVTPVGAGGRKGSGLRTAFVPRIAEDDDGTRESTSTIEISLGDFMVSLKRPASPDDEQNPQKTNIDPTLDQTEGKGSDAGTSMETEYQDNNLQFKDENLLSNTTSDTCDHELTKPFNDNNPPTTPASSPAVDPSSTSESPLPALIPASPDVPSTPAQTHPVEEVRGYPVWIGMDSPAAKRQKIC